MACAFGVAIDQVYVFHLLPLHFPQYIAHYRATRLATRRLQNCPLEPSAGIQRLPNHCPLMEPHRPPSPATSLPSSLSAPALNDQDSDTSLLKHQVIWISPISLVYAALLAPVTNNKILLMMNNPIQSHPSTHLKNFCSE